MKNILILLVVLQSGSALALDPPVPEFIQNYVKTTYGTKATISKGRTVQALVVKLEDRDSKFGCSYFFRESDGHYNLYSFRIDNDNPQKERPHKLDNDAIRQLFSKESLQKLDRYGIHQYADFKKNTASATAPYHYIKTLKPLIPELNKSESIIFGIIPKKVVMFSVRTNVKLTLGANVTDIAFYVSESGLPIYISHTGILHAD